MLTKLQQFMSKENISKLKNINKKDIKKILVISSIVVIVLIGSIVFLSLKDNFDIISYLDSFINNETFSLEETIVEGADFSKTTTKPNEMIGILISRLKSMKY